MSTHTTHLWLATRERGGDVATVDVALDLGVDLCVRLSVGEGGSIGGPRAEAEIHLNPDQAETVATAILACVAMHRERDNDPAWAGKTIECEIGWRAVFPGSGAEVVTND